MADGAIGARLPRADVVIGSPWKAPVGREAGRCRHSFLDNVFAVLDDVSLAEWLDDDEAVREFETCARVVCGHMGLFSPVALLARVRPLAQLPADDLVGLREALAERFDEEFRPDAVERELRERLDRLLATMKARSVRGGTAADELAAIRAAARALHAPMTRLPRGFWLPAPRPAG